MAEADKQLKIAIVVDGTERSVADLDKILAKAKEVNSVGSGSGSASSPGGNSGTAPTVEKEAAAINKKTEAVKNETEAIDKNTEAKKGNATSEAGPRGNQKAAVDDIISKYEKKGDDIARRIDDITTSANKAAPALDKVATAGKSIGGATPGISGFLGALGRLAGPVAAIIGTIKIARDETGSLLDQFEQASPEGFKKFKEANGALVALIRPVETAKEHVRDLFNTFSGGAFTAAKRLTESALAVEHFKKKLKEAQDQRKAEEDAFKSRTIEDRLAAETREVNNQLAAFERLNKVRDAKAGAEDAANQRADKAALASGADPFAVEVNAQTRKSAKELDALQQQLDEARQRQTAAEKLVSTFQTELAEKERDGLVSENETNALRGKIAAAANESSEASLDLKSLTEAIEANKQAVVTAALTGLEDIGRSAAKDIAASKDEISERIKADGEAALEKAGEQAKEIGLKIPNYFAVQLDKLLKDTIPDGDQAAAIANLIAGLRRDLAGNDAEAFKLFTGLQQDALTGAQQFSRLLDNQAAQAETIRLQGLRIDQLSTQVTAAKAAAEYGYRSGK